jgi:shikimate dehydrogenase
MTGRQFRLGVIGDPVAHSISPAMQQPAFDALGIPATYELWHTVAADLPARIASLREPDVLGASVTVPHKVAVMAHLDDISALARRAGAVNTVINRNGHLTGDNTDAHGFAVSLEQACPDVKSRQALVLGAGGAARAVVLALESIGLAHITLANRRLDRAESLAADLAPTPLTVIGMDETALTNALPNASVLINATSLGWHKGETPIPLEWLQLLPDGAIVADLTYRDTDLLEAARERGYATLDGLGMLVYQGARAFQLWTGREAPVQTMLDAARQARAARA